MRKFLWIIFVAVSLLFVGCNHGDLGGVDFPENSDSSYASDSSVVTAPEEENAVKYAVTYLWNNYGEIYDGIDNFPEQTTKGLNIPTEYTEGKSLVLPKLNPWRKNAKIAYDFEGWYYDEALENEVEGNTLPATQTGNITLYAKFTAYIN